LVQRYGQSDLSDADYIVAIGGDGTVLKALHAALLTARKAVFAMRAAGRWGSSQTASRSPAFLSDCEWHAA
jgi:NAD+ kinase